MVEFHAWQGFGACGPFRFRAEQDCRVGEFQFGALHASIAEGFQRCAQFAHLTEQFGVFACVGHERGVEGFGTECGGTPLEEVDGVGAHGHMRNGVAYGFTLALACVERLPLHGRSGVFHHIPRLAECEGIHQSVGAEQLVDMGFALVEVVVVRHEIDFFGPVGIIHAALVGGDHEVCGERLVGADFGDCITFSLVEVEQHIVAEAFEIKLLTGVHHGIGTHEARDEHFVESVHFLTPEGSAPRFVEVFDGAIFTLAPQAECVERVVGVIVTVVPAVFVAHMPCGDVRVGAVTFGQFAAQGERVFLEYRACRAPGLARSRVDGMAEFVSRQHFRVLFVQPQRCSCGCGCQVNRNAGFAKLVDDTVEPPEIPTVFFRLNAIPAENGHGHGIDTGLFHEADVFVPHVFRPLVGIVITAVCDAFAVVGQQFRPFEGLAIGVIGVTGMVGFFGFVVFFALIIEGPHILTFPNILDTTVYLLTILYNRYFCNSVNFDCASDSIPIHEKVRSWGKKLNQHRIEGMNIAQNHQKHTPIREKVRFSAFFAYDRPPFSTEAACSMQSDVPTCVHGWRRYSSQTQHGAAHPTNQAE